MKKNFDSSFIDLQFYSVFRRKSQKVMMRGGDLFWKQLKVAKKNSSVFNDVYKSYAFIYDLGHYKAKKKCKQI